MSTEEPAPTSGARWRRPGAIAPWALAAALTAALALTAPDEHTQGSAVENVLSGHQLRIMAPANPGGGWDQTSRELQASLRDLTGRTEVYNVGGAGGTIGLSQFTRLGPDPWELMTTGAIMVGAVASNHSPVTLSSTTPLARLTTDYQIIVVPKDSKIQNMRELADAMKADVTKVSIAGGSAGGVEQILTGLIAADVGADPSKTNYVAHSGGGEALTTLLSGRATAGISGVSEIEPQVRAGTLRALAVSSPKRLPNVPDVPTLKESGVDVELQNWRGVMAPKGISKAEEQALEDLFAEMVKSPQWRETLERRGWGDAFLAGPEFETFVKDEEKRTQEVLDQIGIG